MSQLFGIIPMHPGTLLDGDELETIIGGYIRALESLGGERQSDTNSSTDGTPVFLMVATGGSEEVILRWSASSSREYGRRPPSPDRPSRATTLCQQPSRFWRGCNRTANRVAFSISEGPDDEAGLAEITDTVHDIDVRRALQEARIGLVGTPSDWLVASSPEASTIRAVWGPSIVPIEMEEVVQSLGAVDGADLASHVDALTAGAIEVREPSTSDIRDVGRVYLALKYIVTKYQLDALTVRCFDLVLNQQTTGCFALAQLTDEGIIAGCEGDLVSTIGLLWARKLLGTTPWMANPAQLDPESNTLWLAHCTVPRTLVENYRLRSHFESGLGVGIQGTLPRGPGHPFAYWWYGDGPFVARRGRDPAVRQRRKPLPDPGRSSSFQTAAPSQTCCGRRWETTSCWCSATTSIDSDAGSETVTFTDDANW